jgi:amidase
MDVARTMASATGLAMSWDEWRRPAGVAIAERVRAKELTPGTCAPRPRQPSSGSAGDRGGAGVFDDVIANPDRDCPSKAGRLYGVPILLKDLGSGLAGRTQEAGSLLSRDDVAPATDPLVANYLEAGLPEQAFLTEKLKHRA